MKQPKLISMLESIINIIVGFGISLWAQWFFLPLLGAEVSFHANLVFALIMTVISIARSFALRRVFEALHIRRPLSPFMQACIAERFRQIEVEGWSADHDDKHHKPGELATAGAAYAVRAPAHFGGNPWHIDRPVWWPWTDSWWKPTDFRRDLVKACALIIAEGERYDRTRRDKRAEWKAAEKVA